MLDEFVLATNVLQAGEADLSDNGSELATGSRDTVRRTSVTRREHLTRDDERGRVGAEVLEEVGQAVKEYEGSGSCGGSGEFIISETYRTEVNTDIRRWWHVAYP